MEGTVQIRAQGRRTDHAKGSKLKKRGGAAAPTTQVRLLKSASTKRLMLLAIAYLSGFLLGYITCQALLRASSAVIMTC